MTTVFSPRQTRLLEVIGICLLFFTMGFSLFYQFEGLKLDGADLIIVCIIIINYVNLFRSQIAQASARIDKLEEKLSTPPRA